MVAMADGSFKAIETVGVGERVLGRYGEANEVLALDRPRLGHRSLYHLNGEHWTTGEHPHWTEEGPMAVDPRELLNDWGFYHPVILADGRVEEWLNTGLARPVGTLRIGARACHGDGVKEIRSIAVRPAAPELALYNLVLGGSHTMRVDGYLVTGWPQEQDFDYDRWEPRAAHYVAPRRVSVMLARGWREPRRARSA
jgi:hypothetical protein